MSNVQGTFTNSSNLQVASNATPSAKMNVPKPDVANKLLPISASLGGTALTTSFTIQKDRTLNLGDIEAPAVIMIVNAKTGVIQYITNSFFLQSIQKPKMERFQIIETFRESKLLFFGERTKIYSITGILLENQNQAVLTTEDAATLDAAVNAASKGAVSFGADPSDAYRYRWSTGLQSLYNKHMRGTKLAEKDNIAILSLENYLIYGYPLQLQIQQDSSNPNLAQFQMTWAITDEEPVNISPTDEESTYSLFQSQKSGAEAAKQKKLAAELKKLAETFKKAEAAYNEIQTAFDNISNTRWSDMTAERRQEEAQKVVDAEDAKDRAQNAYLKKAQSLLAGIQ